MKRAAILGGVLAAILAASASQGQSVAVTNSDRVFRNFTREAATVGDGNLRLEVRGMTMEDDENVRLDLLGFPVREIEREVDIKRGQPGSQVRTVRGGVIDLLGSYGLGPNAELGFVVPFMIMETRFRPPCEPGQVGQCDSGQGVSRPPTRNSQDVGDVLLYGKFLRSVAEHCVVAGGVELSVPTGIEDKRFGTGEVGVNPFIATRYQRGRFGIGGHAGYNIYTGDVDDVFNYSAYVILRGTAEYALRAEVSGRLFRAGGTNFHDATLLPGIDFHVTDWLTVRPTGLANLTDEAVDWGLGLGIAAQL